MRKLGLKVIGGILSIILLFSTFCIATTEQEIKDKINETEQQITGVKKEKSAAQKEVDKLTTQIEEYEAEIDQLDGQISTLNAKIEDSQNKIKEAEENYKKQEELLEKRLIASYMSGETSYLDFLLSSDNIVDMISNYYLVSKITDADTELLEEIEKKKQEIEKAKKELEVNKQELATSKASKQSVSTQLQSTKKEKNKQIANLSEEEKDLEAQLEKYKKEYLAEQERMRKAAEEAARKEQLEQEKNNNPVGGTTNSKPGGVHNGKMTWPCPNYTYISSYFGGRTSPGGIGSTNHQAIDLAAPHGASILAAGSGTVIYVSNTCRHDYPKNTKNNCHCGGGFGNYLQISHGNGIVTVYAHCASINVSVGQTVSAGQMIGTVGCTGHSTGNHLHFGMIKNGTYVDPLPYIQ